MNLHLLVKQLDIEIDTLYNIERSNKLYQTLPQALFSSPVIVLFSILALLLPLSGVFAPGSITVTTRNYTDVPGPCTIPTGNLSTPNASDSTSFFITGGVGFWSSVTPRVTTLTTQWFVEQRIPDLPQACGPNCIYTVSVPSFVMQCRPNPASLPYRQAGAPPESDGLRTITLWNGTTDPNSMWDFYIAWQSNGPNGTSGNACCSAVQAQYTLEVCRIMLLLPNVICLFFFFFVLSSEGPNERGHSISYNERLKGDFSHSRRVEPNIGYPSQH